MTQQKATLDPDLLPNYLKNFLTISQYKSIDQGRELCKMLCLEVSAQKQKVAVEMIIYLQMNSKPQAKVCILQFLKQLLDCCNFQLLSIVEQKVVNIIRPVLQYRKSVKNIMRGSTFFMQSLSKYQNQQKVSELIRLSNTYFRMCHQIVYVCGNKYWPNTEFGALYREMKDQCVFPIYPNDFKFYKESKVQHIAQSQRVKEANMIIQKRLCLSNIKNKEQKNLSPIKAFMKQEEQEQKKEQIKLEQKEQKKQNVEKEKITEVSSIKKVNLTHEKKPEKKISKMPKKSQPETKIIYRESSVEDPEDLTALIQKIPEVETKNMMKSSVSQKQLKDKAKLDEKIQKKDKQNQQSEQCVILPLKKPLISVSLTTVIEESITSERASEFSNEKSQIHHQSKSQIIEETETNKKFMKQTKKQNKKLILSEKQSDKKLNSSQIVDTQRIAYSLVSSCSSLDQKRQNQKIKIEQKHNIEKPDQFLSTQKKNKQIPKEVESSVKKNLSKQIINQSKSSISEELENSSSLGTPKTKRSKSFKKKRNSSFVKLFDDEDQDNLTTKKQPNVSQNHIKRIPKLTYSNIFQIKELCKSENENKDKQKTLKNIRNFRKFKQFSITIVPETDKKQQKMEIENSQKQNKRQQKNQLFEQFTLKLQKSLTEKISNNLMQKFKKLQDKLSQVSLSNVEEMQLLKSVFTQKSQKKAKTVPINFGFSEQKNQIYHRNCGNSVKIERNRSVSYRKSHQFGKNIENTYQQGTMLYFLSKRKSVMI